MYEVWVCENVFLELINWCSCILVAFNREILQRPLDPTVFYISLYLNFIIRIFNADFELKIRCTLFIHIFLTKRWYKSLYFSVWQFDKISHYLYVYTQYVAQHITVFFNDDTDFFLNVCLPLKVISMGKINFIFYFLASALTIVWIIAKSSNIHAQRPYKC